MAQKRWRHVFRGETLLVDGSRTNGANLCPNPLYKTKMCVRNPHAGKIHHVNRPLGWTELKISSIHVNGVVSAASVWISARPIQMTGTVTEICCVWTYPNVYRVFYVPSFSIEIPAVVWCRFKSHITDLFLKKCRPHRDIETVSGSHT